MSSYSNEYFRSKHHTTKCILVTMPITLNCSLTWTLKVYTPWCYSTLLKLSPTGTFLKTVTTSDPAACFLMFSKLSWKEKCCDLPLVKFGVEGGEIPFKLVAGQQSLVQLPPSYQDTTEGLRLACSNLYTSNTQISSTAVICDTIITFHQWGLETKVLGGGGCCCTTCCLQKLQFFPSNYCNGGSTNLNDALW